jgi:hypothetical protein
MKDAKNTKIVLGSCVGERASAAEQSSRAKTRQETRTGEPLRPGMLSACRVWVRGASVRSEARSAEKARRGVHWAYLHCSAILSTVMMSV